MKKILILNISFFLFFLFLPTLCNAQTNYINVTEEVVGEVPKFTWGANFWPFDIVAINDGITRSKITLGRIDMSLDIIFATNTTPPNPDYISLDRLMNATKNSGKEPLLIVDYMPAWLSGDPDYYRPTYTPPSNMTKFLELLEIVINHVKDDVIYYEIWNEPNIHFWSGTEIEYRDFLINVSQKIKSLDPDAVILAPALNNLDIEPSNSRFVFLREVCVNASNYFDIFSFHIYVVFPKPGLPDTWPTSMDYFKQLLNQYGCGNKPLWMTEVGIWASYLNWDNRDVLRIAKSRKVLLDYNVEAQVYFPFRDYFEGGKGWHHHIYNSSDKTFSLVGKYYQIAGQLKFYGDKLNIVSNIQDNVSEISFVAAKNTDNNVVVQITNSFSTNRELRVNFQDIKNITVYESSSDHDFSSSLFTDTNSYIDLTLKPYSVYLIEAKSTTSIQISGRLRNATNTIQANVTIYQNRTNSIIKSAQTINGVYGLSIYPGVYDLQYTLTNFFIPNFFIKLVDLVISSSLSDIVNYVTSIGNQNVSFTVSINDSQIIETYSSKRPARVLINGTSISEVSSYSQLTNNTWFYNSTEKKLYILAAITPSNNLIDGLPPADYYVVEANSVYYAINGSDQQIFLTNSNAATVINTVFQKMIAGQKIIIRGNIQVNATLIPPSGIYIDFGSSEIHATGNMQYIVNFAYKNNLTIDGGKWYGDGFTGIAIRSYTANQITVENAIFENFRNGDVIMLNTGYNHLVQNNIFNNNGLWAIVFNDGGDSKILNNTIYCNNDGAGIGIFAYASDETTYTKNEIAYNTVRDWSQMLWHAIYIDGCPNTTIHDNDVSAPNTNGLAILVKSKSTQIFNNKIHDVSSYGISLYQSESRRPAGSPNGSRIFNNIITNTKNGLVIEDRYGLVGDIEFYNNTISGNRYSQNAAILILPSFMLTNTTYRNNLICNVSYGVRFGYWGDTVISNGIKILKNTFKSISISPVMTIQNQNTTNTVIAYNDFSNAGVSPLTDNGLNTMVYNNTGLVDKNVPAEKIPPPDTPTPSQC